MTLFCKIHGRSRTRKTIGFIALDINTLQSTLYPQSQKEKTDMFSLTRNLANNTCICKHMYKRVIGGYLGVTTPKDHQKMQIFTS